MTATQQDSWSKLETIGTSTRKMVKRRKAIIKRLEKLNTELKAIDATANQIASSLPATGHDEE